jgi:hypothetical protein
MRELKTTEKGVRMSDLAIILLAGALALNGFLAWSAARMGLHTAKIASDINQKTDQLLKHAELAQESLIEVLRATKQNRPAP